MYKSARGYNHPPTSFVSKSKIWILKKNLTLAVYPRVRDTQYMHFYSEEA
jgi:hypothetical protein